MNLDKITQRYLDLFPGDFSGNPVQRQTPNFFFALTDIYGFKKAQLLHFNENLAEEIGFGKIENQEDTDFLNATKLPENVKTFSTAYAGHQFGQWAGQLGDGRAIYAGEIQNSEGKSTEIQWKGAGATPYSRHADGRAVLRSSIREYLMSEAMFHLGIPTTRALSLSLSGEKVARDIMYNGNVDFEQGAVVIRTSETFLRFGHFELLAARNELDTLQKLADFTIENYFSEIDKNSTEKYLEFFKIVGEKTADMIVEWIRVGFTHGVMNTDNMSIIGNTIDYGPFSFLDEYNLNFTSNTTDLPGRRYAFGKQAHIAHWNLIQLANALFPLIKDEAALEKILIDYSEMFWKKHDEMMAKKFGFEKLESYDADFFTSWQKLMEEISIDYTLVFSLLESLEEGSNIIEHFKKSFYQNLNKEQETLVIEFVENYRQRLSYNQISKEDSQKIMQKANPKFVLRNYLLYDCIAEMEEGKTELFDKLWNALQNPYEEIYPEFSVKRPEKYEGVVGCSSLSCSS
ncbi:MAG: YdiU family protein [Cloacibacterium sp.]|uniref:protein adenylyltransferase SelO n=1 Tax=Cloacibacterium sp. TaxID=1913682 RepID=UPI003C7856CD